MQLGELENLTEQMKVAFKSVDFHMSTLNLEMLTEDPAIGRMNLTGECWYCEDVTSPIWRYKFMIHGRRNWGEKPSVVVTMYLHGKVCDSRSYFAELDSTAFLPSTEVICDVLRSTLVHIKKIPTDTVSIMQ